VESNPTALRAGNSQPYFQSDFPVTEFAERRARIAATIGADAIAMLQGGGETGAFDMFRQTNEMYYLSGVEVPHAYLSIDGRTRRSTLYLPHRDEKHERSDGPQLNCDAAEVAKALTGVDEVRPLKALEGLLSEAKVVLTPFSPGEGRQTCRDTQTHASKARAADPWEAQVSREGLFRARLAQINPLAAVQDLTPVLDGMRIVKSENEIRMMRRAGRLSALAVKQAMLNTRAGVFEYHLGAIADYVYQCNGSRAGGGYRPIIACGRNIWNAHYYRNNCELTDGEWVLMDFAPDVGYYTSDIGRYWPVNGTYSNTQRELYGFIVEYHKTLLTLIRPGVTAAQVMDEVAAKMEPVVSRTKWSSRHFEVAARKTLSFRGHLSHSVGMAVHDVGNYHLQPLRPGVVFALDPQMWVPEEQIYVRVEDTVVVTQSGVEVLTDGVPLELDEVESLMKSRGSLLEAMLSESIVLQK
jgi:Xaa-Pro aminopeptidase